MDKDGERTYSTKEVTRIVEISKQIDEYERLLSFATNWFSPIEKDSEEYKRLRSSGDNRVVRKRNYEDIDKIQYFIRQIREENVSLNHPIIEEETRKLEDKLFFYHEVIPQQQDDLHSFPVTDGNVYSLPYHRYMGFPKKR